MNTIQCLYLEDQASDYEFYEQLLATILAPDVAIKFTLIKSPLDAIKELQERGSTFDLFLADLLFREDPNDPRSPLREDGIFAVGEARKHANLAIVALSVAERDHPGITRRFNDAGGHLYLDKMDIRDGRLPSAGLRDMLFAVFHQKNSIHGSTMGSLKWNRGMIQLDAIIETIGPRRFESLLNSIAPECVRFEPHYVAPGYSGAFVVRVVGHKENSINPDAELLVKCSRDGGKLKRELDNAPEAREPASHIYVKKDSLKVFEQEGWYASAWRFQEDAVTLLNWLLEDVPDSEKIDQVFSRLFTSGLVKDLKRMARAENDTAVTLLSPDLVGKARIDQSIRSLRPLIAKSRGKASSQCARISDFVIRGEIGGKPLNQLKMGTWETMCHGDLHCRNVLVVTQQEQPWVIDPARRGVRHWAADHARMCVDLWMSGWSGGISSHHWEDLDKWENSFASWIRNELRLPRKGTTNRSIFYSLNWLKTSVNDTFWSFITDGEILRCEFQLALTIEFLNMSCYETFPTPKRCLALLCAEFLLSESEDLLQWK